MAAPPLWCYGVRLLMARLAPGPENLVFRLLELTEQLVIALERLRFTAPVTHVYNPLSYARRPYERYLERYGKNPREVLLLGMNPGPWGMAQTGVPFGAVAAVRDWLGIEEPVERPAPEHPARPVLGFACPREEVSGTRLWGWAREQFGTPECFFERFFVANYCPLLFYDSAGRNLTPDKLPAAERAPLFAACDEALRRMVEAMGIRWAVGVGAFAEARLREALAGYPARVGRILHPSPASPAANRGWAEAVARDLRALGIDPLARGLRHARR
jgi:single-strand selective monofunctional uracil DNA glycosylase